MNASRRTVRKPSPNSVLVILALSCSATCVSAQAPQVRLTWLSNTAWLIEAGETTLMLDPAISRPDLPLPDADDPQTFLTPPTRPDEPSVRRVYEALRLSDGVDWILIGHGHSDHAFDTAVWARLTGAKVIGSRTACFQAFAQGLARSDCRIVEGGEVIELGPRLRVRVVRWHHSGNPEDRLGRLVQTPIELRAVPAPDPATGALRPSGVQDFPNGGGSRAFLFTYGDAGQEFRWLVSDTGNPAVFDVPATGKEEWFTDLGIPFDNLEITDETVSTRDYLVEALSEEEVTEVDLWIGYWPPQHVAQVVPILRPRAFIPNHWIGQAFLFDGLPRPLSNPDLSAVLRDAGVELWVPSQFAARYGLDSAGIHELPSEDLQTRLGIGR